MELIDIFPTINDILGVPKYDKKKFCRPMSPDITLPQAVCHTLQGKSLVSAVLGGVWDQSPKGKKIMAKRLLHQNGKEVNGGNRRQLMEKNGSLKLVSTVKKREKGMYAIDRGIMRADSPMTTNSVQYKNQFSITQSLRCSPVLINSTRHMSAEDFLLSQGKLRTSPWRDCDKTNHARDVFSVMGYSLRTKNYRYTAWFVFDRQLSLPKVDDDLFEEEVPLLCNRYNISMATVCCCLSDILEITIPPTIFSKTPLDNHIHPVVRSQARKT